MQSIQLISSGSKLTHTEKRLRFFRILIDFLKYQQEILYLIKNCFFDNFFM